MHKEINVSVYFKIFTALIVITMFFYATIFMLNITSTNEIKNKILKSEISNLNYFLNGFEKEINRILKVQEKYLFDLDLMMLSNAAKIMSDFSMHDSVLSLINKLAVLKSSSNFIEDVSVHIPLIDRSLSPDYHIAPLNTVIVNSFKDYNSYQHSPIRFWNGDYYLYVQYPRNYDVTSNGMKYSISIKLSSEEIKRNMSNIIKNVEGSSAVLFDDNKQWSITIETDESTLNKNIHKVISDYENEQELKIDNINYLVFNAASSSSKFICLYFVRQQSLLYSLIKHRRLFWSVVVLNFIILAIMAYWIYNIFKVPLDKLVSTFKILETGKFDISINYKHTDEFGYIYSQFNNMVKRLKSLVVDVYEQKIRLKSAILKQLQYQINPHFLYNSLFVIYRMAKINDTESIAEFAHVLGNYYRFIHSNESNDIFLLEEIKHCENYVKIQTIRFGSHIKVIWDYDLSDIANVKIPCLILQPIIENAYEHGLKNVGEGIIKIIVSVQENKTTINVEDNGQGMSDQVYNELIDKIDTDDSTDMNNGGILNVHRRLRIKYGNESGIKIRRNLDAGLKVTLMMIQGI